MPVDWMMGLIGGLMIGAAALLLFAVNGRLAGVSGIAFRAPASRGEEAAWRWLWLAGLLAGGLIVLYLTGGFTPRNGFPIWLLLAGGLLTGVGTALGSGCTSGHGVCGIARLSPRSLLATVTFMLTGAAVTFVVRHLWGIQ